MREKRYDRFVHSTPSKHDDFQDWHKKTYNFFLENKFNRILDIGCGTGDFTILLKKATKAKEVYGIEVSKKGAEESIKKGITTLNINIDEHDLPFEKHYFDAIYAGEVIEHLYDSDHFLSESNRVLKPKGVLILTT